MASCTAKSFQLAADGQYGLSTLGKNSSGGRSVASVGLELTPARARLAARRHRGETAQCAALSPKRRSTTPRTREVAPHDWLQGRLPFRQRGGPSVPRRAKMSAGTARSETSVPRPALLEGSQRNNGNARTICGRISPDKLSASGPGRSSCAADRFSMIVGSFSSRRPRA